MKLRNVFGMLLSLFVLVIVGCGGGNDNNGPGGTSVSGSAVKGPITGGSVQVFEIISSASTPRANIPRIGTTVLATGTTAADGSFSLTIPASLRKGGVLFKLTGGSYKDEATGLTRNVNDQVPVATGLRAAFSNISGITRRGDTLNVNITPFTELAVQSLLAAPVQPPTDAAIAAANARVVTTFGLTGIDITKTKPFDATTAPPVGATQAQKNYSLALAVLSQSQQDSAITLAQLNALLLPDVNAGVLSPANNAAGSAALLNFLNSGTNLSGGTVAPVTVSVTPAVATTTVINTTVTITATVQQGGVNAANGTQVKFAIKSGASGTLSAATATTTNGVASVTLGSATDTAAYVVTATAGGVSTDTATITFVNPNKPSTVTVVASPTSGVTGGLGPVTLTATVTPGVGGTLPVGTAVTFTITGGTAAASGAITNVTTTNASGVATATLNSTAAGTITVNANAGTAPVVTSTPDTSVSFITAPTQAIVKLAISGTVPAGTTIDGASFILNYVTNKGLSITDTPAAIAASGGALANLIINNVTVNGVLQSAFANANASPIKTQAGEFATLTFAIANNTPPFFPLLGEFTIASSNVATTPVLATPLTVTVLSLTLQ